MSTVRKHKVGPRRRLWTKDEFYCLLDLGFFEEQRVELIEGVIVEMPAQQNFHALGIKFSEEARIADFGPGHWERVQMTLDCSIASRRRQLASPPGPEKNIGILYGSRASSDAGGVEEGSRWSERSADHRKSGRPSRARPRRHACHPKLDASAVSFAGQAPEPGNSSGDGP